MITVTCNGCFDKLHSGHFFFLGYCLSRGDELVVGINSDNYIRKNKRSTPHRSEEQRRDDLLSLCFIKDVIIFSEPDPIEFIKSVSPHVHCTGAEYVSSCKEEVTCRELGIELVFVPRIGEWASSGAD